MVAGCEASNIWFENFGLLPGLMQIVICGWSLADFSGSGSNLPSPFLSRQMALIIGAAHTEGVVVNEAVEREVCFITKD